MAKAQILVAESNEILLEGITIILSNSNSLRVVDKAVTAKEAAQLFKKHTPDVCLVSDTLEELNIHEFMQTVYEHNEDARVVILTNTIDVNQLNQALKAGVSGCLLKTIDKKQLCESLISAANGDKVFSKQITKLMASHYTNMTQNNSTEEKAAPITKRESEVLQLIVDGYTSQEIAELLYISPRTVETHRSNLLHKLNQKNTAGLVRYALEEGRLK